MSTALPIPLRLHSPSDIDLTRHSVVEASAGTGKTYTIEHAYIRLLTEKAIPFDRILLVTFTEKATLELRDRLRQKLRAFVRDNPSPVITQALREFHRMQVFTLHGFCQRLLREFPSLGAYPAADASITSDYRLAQELVPKALYGYWAERYGDGDELSALLLASGFPGSYRDNGPRSWLQKVIALALRWKPLSGDVLLPCGDEDGGENALNIKHIAKLWRENPSQLLQTKGTSPLTQVERLAFMVSVAKRAKLDIAAWKETSGAPSFDDLIAWVYQGLCKGDAEAERIRKHCSERYRVAIIDEFQDTDALQWGIIRSLFIDNEVSRVLLIGDPKQAIYQFRGADVRVYESAKAELLLRADSAFYDIATNYRSAPRLITAFNAIFSNPLWFGSHETLVYRDAEVPAGLADDEKQLSAENLLPSGLQLMQLPDDCNAELAKKIVAAGIASEIVRLLGEKSQIVTKNGLMRPIALGDIAVLVRAKGEAIPIRSAFLAARIPLVASQRESMYQTPEARQLCELLIALGNPQQRGALRACLLGPWFALSLEQLACMDLVANHTGQADDAALSHVRSNLQHALDRFFALREAALHRNWDTWYALATTPPDIAANGETPQSNVLTPAMLQLIRSIAILAITEHADLATLTERLQSAMANAKGGNSDDGALEAQPQEDKVSLLTMHVAKGLEFPVVFIAGGFGKNLTIDVLEYHDADGHRVYNLDTSDATAKALHNAAQSDEERRLFYVALTRARTALYVPLYKPKKHATNGTLATLIAPVLNSLLQQAPDLCNVIALNDLPRNIPTLSARESERSQEISEDALASASIASLSDAELFSRRISVSSFSAMAKDLDAHGEASRGEAFQEKASEGADLHPFSVPRSDEVRSEGTSQTAIWPGARSGSAIHSLLERFDYHASLQCRDPDDLPRSSIENKGILEATYEELLSCHPVEQRQLASLRYNLERELHALLFATLSAPFLGGTTSLRELAATQRLHEFEFFSATDRAFIGKRTPKLLTGYIDLLLSYNSPKGQRYALVDFKTNLLPSYDQKFLAASVAEHHYDMQMAIYEDALRRIAADAGRDAAALDGIYYLYLRGMIPAHPTAGVYYVPCA